MHRSPFGPLHGLPRFGQPSSTTPLQSSSMPLPHRSTAPGSPGTASHTTAFMSAEHTYLPVRLHAPTPAWHGLPSVGKPSSTWPLQSSSTPLPHSSMPGMPGIASHTTDLP